MQHFINFLVNTHRAKVAFWLAASLAISFGLIFTRVTITGTGHFRFLVWNLFLAFIPYVISTLLAYRTSRRKNLLIITAAASLWLLFFPNAPYILTDLFHLKQRSGIPYWFDLLMLLSAAWTGLMLGFVSLADMQSVISNTFNKLTGWIFVVISMLLTGFGIYLGRYERWNSWDIVTNPTGLAKNILSYTLHPMDYPRVWAITVAFAAFLIVGYFTIRQLGKIPLTATKNDNA